MPDNTGKIFDLPELRNRGQVFRDRTHAGAVLVGMLNALRGTDTLILAIPAGGVPVAAEVAKQLDLPLDLAVVSKITLPWSTESGYGAVAFDGTVRLNEELIAVLALRPDVVRNGIAKTKEKVERRVQQLRGDRRPPELKHRTAVLIDDGLASGFTMLTAVDAMRNLAAEKIVIAVPTGHADAATRIAAMVDSLYCPNVREGYSFAVADAYEHWTDVDEATVAEIMRPFGKNH
ncbi:MAG: phosphoribosyltransferase [Gammaproteobacteria bacterium]|nr:phosphoribosyltransferase [Gammaproteobacteria bacterium]